MHTKNFTNIGVIKINCFFDTQVSDILQHIAIFFEIGAVYILWSDYKKRNQDLHAKTMQGLMTGGLGPTPSRRKELVVAYIIGFLAILMELYQLLTQYFAC